MTNSPTPQPRRNVLLGIAVFALGLAVGFCLMAAEPGEQDAASIAAGLAFGLAIGMTAAAFRRH